MVDAEDEVGETVGYAGEGKEVLEGEGVEDLEEELVGSG